MTKLAENNPQGTANIADDRVLATVLILYFMNHQFKQNKADEYYTKEYAIKPLLKYIPTDKTV